MKTRINFYDYMGKQYNAIMTKDNIYNNYDVPIIFKQNEHVIKSAIINIDEDIIIIRAYRKTKD